MATLMHIPRLLPQTAILAAVLSSPALASIISVPFGTSAPPGTLGGYAMLPFSDPRPEGVLVTSVAPPVGAPVAGDLMFDVELEHFSTGGIWSTWSHGFIGDVYWLDEFFYGNTVTLTLPGDTKAFYLYVEPDFFGTFTFSLTSGATTEVFPVDGDGGASGVGFYTDNPADSLVSVMVEKLVADPAADFSNGFAIGEFGINGIPGAPEGSVPPLLGGLVFLGLAVLYRRLKA